MHGLPGPKSGLRLALLICLHSIIQTGGGEGFLSRQGWGDPTQLTKLDHIMWGSMHQAEQLRR